MLFEIGAIESGRVSGDVALVAIKDGDLHADFGDAFPPGGEGNGAERFIVVFEAAAELEIGNRFPLGAREHGGGAGGIGFGDARGRGLRGDGFDGLIFVEVGPVVFEISGDGRERKIRAA